MRNNNLIQFEECLKNPNWNLGKALQLIKIMKKDEKLFNNEQMKFITHLEADILKLFEQITVNQNDTVQEIINPQHEEKELTAKEILKKYSEMLVENVKIINTSINQLINEIIENQNINFGKNFFIDSLLDNLMHAINALQRNIAIKYNNDKFYLNSLDNKKLIYQAAIQCGGKFLPFCQILDPLSGSTMDKESLGNFLGACFGYTFKWIKQASETGSTSSNIFLDYDVNYFQRNNINLRNQLDSKTYYISNAAEFAKKILLEVTESTITSIGLFHADQSGGHALAIRKIIKNNQVQIEFFEPDYGIFYFNNEKNFIDWFVYYFTFINSSYREHYGKAKFFQINLENNKIEAFSLLEKMQGGKANKIVSNDILLLLEVLKNNYDHEITTLEKEYRYNSLITHFSNAPREYQSRFRNVSIKYENDIYQLLAFYLPSIESSDAIYRLKVMITNYQIAIPGFDTQANLMTIVCQREKQLVKIDKHRLFSPPSLKKYEISDIKFDKTFMEFRYDLSLKK